MFANNEAFKTIMQLELLIKDESNQSEIARILQVDKSIICRDIAYLRQQAKENIKKYIDERLPE
jgi:transcriptional regulator